jgi:hypothetical protein
MRDTLHEPRGSSSSLSNSRKLTAPGYTANAHKRAKLDDRDYHPFDKADKTYEAMPGSFHAGPSTWSSPSAGPKPMVSLPMMDHAILIEDDDDEPANGGAHAHPSASLDDTPFLPEPDRSRKPPSLPPLAPCDIDDLAASGPSTSRLRASHTQSTTQLSLRSSPIEEWSDFSPSASATSSRTVSVKKREPTPGIKAIPNQVVKARVSNLEAYRISGSVPHLDLKVIAGRGPTKGVASRMQVRRYTCLSIRYLTARYDSLPVPSLRPGML